MDDGQIERFEVVEGAEGTGLVARSDWVVRHHAELRRVKEEREEYAELLEGPRFSDYLAESAEGTMLMRLGGAEARRITRTEMLSMQGEMLREGDSPVEILLVRQISLCHLTVQVFRREYMELDIERIGNKAHAVLLKRLNQANEQYMSAIKTLAQVRRLRKLTVQVNIGDKQVNIAHIDGNPGALRSR